MAKRVAETLRSESFAERQFRGLKKRQISAFCISCEKTFADGLAIFRYFAWEKTFTEREKSRQILIYISICFHFLINFYKFRDLFFAVELFWKILQEKTFAVEAFLKISREKTFAKRPKKFLTFK